jgi:predicted AlkP superfamily phosphohydrolase/phosphomutase
MDGLDPDILRSMMEKGELPNFSRLRDRGGLNDLRVPNPPISPTSWASFITGTNPGRHGIYGFIGRNPDGYGPELFTSLQPAKTFLGLPAELDLPGPYKVPLFPGQFVNKRGGEAFWDITSRNGIRSNVIRVPVTFPPEPVNGKMLSGLGTPDLKGTQGTYFYWTEKRGGASGKSGEVATVFFSGSEAQSTLPGPSNTLRDRPRPVELDVRFDRSDTGTLIDIEGQSPFFLEEGTWSDWRKLSFNMGLGMSASGIARFHLNSTDPFELYMTPIQINPKDPVMQISHPEGYARKLAQRLGFFYTMGMAQDDQALKDDVLNDTTFVEQNYQGLRERRRILSLELRRENNGLLVGVFDTTDRIQHLMWRHRDEKHPLHDPELAEDMAEVIPNVYRKMDRVLGEVLDSVDRSVPVMVVSDHGFVSFRRQFDVNTWLRENGYLSVRGNQSGPTGRFFRGRRGDFDVRWSETEAYQLGLTGIYLNLKGREGNGTVPRSERWERAKTIKEDLEDVVDPKTGRRVFEEVYLSKNIYDGLRWEDGPDLILGYNEGYRTAWSSARGQVRDGDVITDNRNNWSGDHVVAAPQVPGTLMTSFPVEKSNPAITDVAPTVLRYYGIEPPAIVDGETLMDWD